MAIGIGRRKFISALGGAVTWPSAARAQQLALPVIGFLDAVSGRPEGMEAFHRGLKEAGFVEGQNVAIESRSANGQVEQLPALAADLVRRQPAVIVAAGGANSALAAKAATSTIPIVVVFGSDPLKLGLIASFSRPDGNITGVTFLGAELTGKQFALMHQIVPSAKVFVFLSQSGDPLTDQQENEAVAAARVLGRQIDVLRVRSDHDFEGAFASMLGREVALIAGIFPLFGSNRATLTALAARSKIPAMFPYREYALAGGLVSYGAKIIDSFRLGGIYVGQILKGVKPADLPFQQPTKFELVINLKTARELGIEVPPAVLSVADELIE
jgi:putative ABC transport system substrate-binding protein